MLDADIRGFFDHIDHWWMMKFVQHRVADPRMLRLIQKWLKAGVMEGEQWSETEMGTPQGAVISPLLANIYLHYVFDLWVDVWRRKCAQGDVIVIRYADDSVLGFQYQTEADDSWEISRDGWGSLGWNSTPTRRGGSSPGGMPKSAGNEEGKASPRRSTFWVSRTSAGRLGRGTSP